MTKKNGFTLIELLAVTVIVALIMVAVVPNLISTLRRTKDKEYNSLIEKAQQASITYVEERSKDLTFLKNEKDYIYIDFQKLVDEGFFDKKIKNPKTEELIDLTSKIRIEKVKAHNYLVDVFVDSSKYAIEKQLYDYKVNVYNVIQGDLTNRTIVDASSCGTDCIDIKYSDKTIKQLLVDKVGNRVVYNGINYAVAPGSTISGTVILTNNVTGNKNTLTINIPITYPNMTGNYNVEISKIYDTYSRTNMIIWLDGYDAHVAGVWKDKSGNNYNGTITNMVGTSTSGYDAINRAYAFAGDNDYIDIVDLPASINWASGYTVEFVAKWNSLNSWSRIMDFGVGQPIDNILFANSLTTNNIEFDTYNNTTGLAVSATNVIDSNSIISFQITVNGAGATTIYKNGKILTSGTSMIVRNILRNNNFLGRSNWVTDGYFNGLIYGFRIYNRVLLSDELSYNYGLDKEKYIQ
jgi:prepilin-type N-terminal cleavage/methylation domain-containing protein